MKNVTLLFIAFFTCLFVNAQTTFTLDWTTNVNGPDASFILEPGDTVEWTWADSLPHSVTSIDGSSVETFDSGVQTGLGFLYSYTFNVLGTNDYECVVHSQTMFGTITVEQVASVEDKFAINVNYFPNPVNNKLTVTSLYRLSSYEVFDVLGKRVASVNDVDINVAEIDMSQLKSGVYFVKVKSNDLQKTFKVVKN